MELREPPRPRPSSGSFGRKVSTVSLALLILLSFLALMMRADRERRRHDSVSFGIENNVAAKLKAAGLEEQAARLYERSLESRQIAPGERAEIAHGLATMYMDQGRCEEALRWLYEAESLFEESDVEVRDRIGRPVAEKVVTCLERLGRPLAAKSALSTSTRLEMSPPERAETDPVVARIGERELHRSDVDAALAMLPPAARSELTATAEGRSELLRKVVADDLLLAKAERLGLDRDPQVTRQIEEMRKQAILATFIDREVVSKITVDPADLENFWTANRNRWASPETKETPQLEEVRSAVEAAYRRQKAESAYREMVTELLAGAEVELHPERLSPEGESDGS